MEQAERKFKLTRTEKLTVCVHFNNNYGLSTKEKTLTGRDVAALSDFICDFVNNNCPQYGSYVKFQQFDMTAGIQILPDQITHLSIHHKYNHCTFPKSGIVPDIKGDELRYSIIAKDGKIKNYSKSFDEIWLLLVENQWDMTTYFDFSYADNIEIHSKFNKVFILRSGNNEVIECVNVTSDSIRWKGTEFYV